MQMDADYVLPLECGLFPGESVQGLLVRIAEALRCGSPSWVLGPAGAALPLTPGQDPSWVTRFSRMSHVSEADLLAGAYPPLGDGLVTVAGLAFPLRAVVTGRPRVCPACLAEAPFRRLAWELLPMQVCPRHLCRLLSRCPGCESRFSWAISSVLRCRCGMDLSQAKADEVDEADVLAAAEVGIRLGLEAGRTTLDAPFASMPLPDLLAAFGFLGRTALADDNGKKPRHATLARPDAHVILSAGARVCSRWPDSLFEMLDRTLVRAASGNGMQGAFAAIHASVSRGGERGCWPILRDGLTEYLRLRPDLPLGMLRRSLTFGAGVSDWVDLDEALGILGLTPEEGEQLKRSKRWKSVPATGTSRRRRYARAGVTAFAATLAKLVATGDMARTLGVDERLADDVLRSGSFELMELTINGKATLAVDPEEVLSFLLRLRTAAERRGEAVSEPMRFQGVVGAADECGVPMSVLMGLLSSGALTPSAFDEQAPGFRALVFERTEVEAALARLAVDANGVVTVATVARMVGLTEVDTLALIRQGLIAAVPSIPNPVQGHRSSPVRGYRIPHDEVERFREAFVTGLDLARQAGYRRRPKHWRPLSVEEQRAAGLELVTVIGQWSLDVYRRVGMEAEAA